MVATPVVIHVIDLRGVYYLPPARPRDLERSGGADEDEEGMDGIECAWTTIL
jgi:hypothetical protein